jgi:hypothetical protein
MIRFVRLAKLRGHPWSREARSEMATFLHASAAGTSGVVG